MKKIIILLCAGFILSGCGTFNPYRSEFQCPDTYKGKCVSTAKAYAESIEGSDNTSSKPLDDLEYGYRAGLYSKLASLIEKPATPVVLPSKVMRTLILSYTGSGNELYGYRYVYFFATEPQWIISTTKEIQ